MQKLCLVAPNVVQKVETPSGDSDVEKSGANAKVPTSSRNKGMTVISGCGCPDLKELIAQKTMEEGQVNTVTCGPAGMMLNIRDTFSGAQRRILSGKGRARKVWLHTETSFR
jgi:hypothetical protein